MAPPSDGEPETLGLACERVREPRFANARLAAHEEEDTTALSRPYQRFLDQKDFALAANERSDHDAFTRP